MNKIDAINKYIAAYNTFDIPTMLSLVSEDIIFINISSGEKNTESKGKQSFEKLATQGADMFSSRQQSIVDWEGGEDKDNIICNINFVGELTSEAANQLRCDAKLALRGVSEFTFKKDKICQIIDKS